MTRLLRQLGGAPKVSSDLARFTPQGLFGVACREGEMRQMKGTTHGRREHGESVPEPR